MTRHDYYFYRYDIDNEEIIPKTPRGEYNLHVVTSLQDLEALIDDGCDFCDSPVFNIAMKNASSEKQTFFLYFIEKKLVHANCIVKDCPVYDIQLKRFQAHNALFVGPSFTNEKYRGRGFNAYDLVAACKYFQKDGYEYAYASAKATNKAAIFDMMAAGYQMIDKVRVSRFMKLTLCKSIKTTAS